MSTKRLYDRQVIAAARNLLMEYAALLEMAKEELTKETDAEAVDGKDAFEIARKALWKETRKEAFRDFINRIKTYGNQQLS
ncbi:MAG: hypothetical protein KGI71_06095 [Patescibacteria group bacterium]|nr:hypothetical protein [Patescibacteria group bacterium]